jgi:CBS-domain-containing membrane protein
MTNPVVFCRPETNLAAAIALMWDKDCGALPVVSESGKVTGMITDRDICIALGTRNVRASELTVRDVIHGLMRTCQPDDEIRIALKTMSEGRIRRLPVVGSTGALEGILCMDHLILSAQHCDGEKRRGVSYEDVVNALRAICRCHTHHKSDLRVAA